MSDGGRGIVLRTASSALNIIRLFSDDTPVLGVTDVSRCLGLPKSVVSRIISTFVEDGVLERDELSGKYRLGPLLLELGLIAGELNPVLRVAEPVVKQLRDEAAQNSFLLVRDGGDSVCLVSVHSPHTEALPISAGMRMPLASSVAGWVILAFLDDIARVSDERLHIRDLQAIEQNGFACREEVQAADITTLACPVFTPSGDVTAAVAISGQTKWFRQRNRNELVGLVAHAARKISSQLTL